MASKKERLHLTLTQQQEAIERYSNLYRDKLMEHVGWRKKHSNAIILLKDEEYEQALKDLLAEMDAVANATIDNEQRLPIGE